MLSILNLTVQFQQGKEFKKVINTISFQVKDNAILGIVGESGSGKSVTSLAIMGLLPNEKCKVE